MHSLVSVPPSGSYFFLLEERPTALHRFRLRNFNTSVMEEIKDESTSSLDAFREQIAVKCAVMRQAVEKDVLKRECNLTGATPFVEATTTATHQADGRTGTDTGTGTGAGTGTIDMKKAMAEAIEAAKKEHNVETFGSGAKTN